MPVGEALEAAVPGPLGQALRDDVDNLQQIAAESVQAANNDTAAIELGNRAAAVLDNLDRDLEAAGAHTTPHPAHPERNPSASVRVRELLRKTEDGINRWGGLADNLASPIMVGGLALGVLTAIAWGVVRVLVLGV